MNVFHQLIHQLSFNSLRVEGDQKKKKKLLKIQYYVILGSIMNFVVLSQDNI